MGIRFHCPNGHRLHVKSFLAGKRGVCPDCGAKFEIPRQSEEPTNRQATDAEDEDELASAPEAGAVRRARAPGDVGRPTTPRADAPRPQSFSATAGAPSNTSAATSEPAWFVRPPGGGQYGPATEALFRVWVSEGRVTPECYVWRHGWEDWQMASTALPDLEQIQLPSQDETDVAEDPAAVPVLLPQVTTSEQTLSQATSALRYRQQKHAQATRKLVLLLGAVCMLLLAALIYVVWYR